MARKVMTVSVAWATHDYLKKTMKNTGVPMGRQIDFKVFGKPAKIKKVGDM